MRQTIRIIGIIGWLALLVGGSAYAGSTPVRALADGIALALGGTQVEVRVASPHAFRLHLFHLPDSSVSSIYLSRKIQPPTPYVMVHDGAAVGIKTAFGELLVNPTDETWTLRDGSGATLTDWATLGEFLPAVPGQPAASGQPAKPGKPASFHMLVGTLPISSHPLVYGSGNLPTLGALTQVGVTPRTGNGSAGLPQYWSSGDYGALLVGQDDNAPGSWKTEARGSVSWTMIGDDANLYLMPARNLYEWLRDDAELTGFAPVPPRWAFGYLQSRWGWENKAYIEDALSRFRQDRLPVDAFILDFEWYTKKPDYAVKAEGDPAFTDFSWNTNLLPDPAKQISDFAGQGLRLVGIRKPRLGNAGDLTMARKKGWILPLNPSDPTGGDSRSRNLDFSRPEVRAWWGENNRKFLEAGMVGFWNDEGETTYTEYSYWNMAEVDLLKQVDPEARFWSLNRAFIPGMQRFGAAVWTGDIASDWKVFAKTPGELLSYGLSGMPYSTCDIGGYSGNPTPELLVRWMQAGVFFPMMRSHSEYSCTPHFPWLFGPDAEAAIRKALDLRYRLIPYYYSLAHNNCIKAAPLMRPLIMEFPHDEKAGALTDEWLMGDGLLAAPIFSEGGERSIYLPDDQWYLFGTNEVTQGPQTLHVTSKLDEIPVYVRAGTLLPLGPVLQSTGEVSTVPLEMQIYPGKNGAFDFIEDDGKTLDYQKGITRDTTFSWNDQTKTLSWKITGNYHGDNRFHNMKAVLLAPAGALSKEASLDQDGSLVFH